MRKRYPVDGAPSFCFVLPDRIIPGHNSSKEALMNRKGFTLVELLTVVAILGILAMIAIPGYIGYHKRAQRTEAYSNLQNLRLLEEQYYAENGSYAAPLGTCGANQNNLAAIQAAAALPGFKPGSNVNFSYCVQQNVDISGTATNPCFTARAYGNSGSSVVGDSFAIDCKNNRNF
jgi:prepilin-type N-terminal cleavage/methylation domain-containing protein